MDFYKQRRFICEITGHSGLTFFEALRSEVCPLVEVGFRSPHSLFFSFKNKDILFYVAYLTGNLALPQMEESRELNTAFPDALKEPILRQIQFSTVSRIDHLGKLDSSSPKLQFTDYMWN